MTGAPITSTSAAATAAAGLVGRERAGSGTEALGNGAGDRGGVAPEGLVDDQGAHGIDLLQGLRSAQRHAVAVRVDRGERHEIAGRTASRPSVGRRSIVVLAQASASAVTASSRRRWPAVRRPQDKPLGRTDTAVGGPSGSAISGSERKDEVQRLRPQVAVVQRPGDQAPNVNDAGHERHGPLDHFGGRPPFNMAADQDTPLLDLDLEGQRIEPGSEAERLRGSSGRAHCRSGRRPGGGRLA